MIIEYLLDIMHSPWYYYAMLKKLVGRHKTLRRDLIKLAIAMRAGGVPFLEICKYFKTKGIACSTKTVSRAIKEMIGTRNE